MKRVLRVAAIGIGSLIGLALIALAAVYLISQRRIDAHLAVDAHNITAGTDSAAVARGQHVATAIGMCADCHGTDLGGAVVIDVPPVAVLHGANLTSGQGGVAPTLATDTDWERAIRHGVAPDGRKLLFMPSHEYKNLNDDDIAALIAFLKQLPKVDRTNPPISIGPIGRILALTGDLELLPADLMDHAATHPAPIAPAPTAEYGAYLANTCKGCHGKTLSGGPMPGAPPEWKPPANITPEGIGHYDEAAFFRVLREGMRPDGSGVDTLNMPVRFTRLLSDDELHALFAYLKTVPPKSYGGR